MRGRLTAAILVVAMAASALAAPMPAFAARSAAAIARELAAVRAQVRSAGSAYDRALNALENTDSKMRATDRRMALESKNLQATEALLAKRVEAMYRAGDEEGILAWLLGSTTFEDFITRADLVQLIGDRDAQLILQIKDTRARLDRNRRSLARDRKAQAATLADFKRKRDALQRQLSSVQARYMRLLGELEAAMARERLAGHLTYQPRGPNGMVFPVRGPHYYSNTWGAPRSGGRTHKGTDIMSPRGTPCVAVASGYVDAHSSTLGGLTITLKGDNGWTYYYAHLNGYAVRSGHVSAGQLVGWVGSTGNARGGAPHLHFQMGPGGRWVNPYPYLVRME